PQRTIDKQLLAQQGDQVRKRPAKTCAPLQVLEQQHGNQGRPDLDLQGVGAGTDEALDPQVLLERSEKDFHLPTLLVEAGHSGGTEAQVIVSSSNGCFQSGNSTSSRRRGPG